MRVERLHLTRIPVFDTPCSSPQAVAENADRDVRLQLNAVLCKSNRTPMTKDELMTLAKEGKAHIEETLTYMVTRYRITGDDADDPDTMFVELSEYGVEHAFYTDGEEDTELTASEAEVVRAAIDAAPPEL